MVFRKIFITKKLRIKTNNIYNIMLYFAKKKNTKQKYRIIILIIIIKCFHFIYVVALLKLKETNKKILHHLK